MTTLFFFICAVSVVFFGIFLVACLRPERKSEATPVVRKALPESQAIDAAAGRRFFVHLEEQMARFIVGTRSHSGNLADRERHAAADGAGAGVERAIGGSAG